MDLRRIEIGNKLKAVLGNSNTYFQPPENIKLKYPCAIYAMEGSNTRHANDKVYLSHKRYSVTFITDDPDNDYDAKMAEQFSMVRFDRRYISDNLYHDVYTIY